MMQANVLICEDGRIILADFGMLRSVTDDAEKCYDKLGTGAAAYRCVIVRPAS